MSECEERVCFVCCLHITQPPSRDHANYISCRTMMFATATKASNEQRPSNHVALLTPRPVSDVVTNAMYHG